MIAGLSDLLRYSLDHAGKHVVPLAQELAILERYLEIQTLRFSDRLAARIDIPDELRDALVPALLLQPLVENAIRHGVERATEPGAIEVSARRAGDSLEIEVFNTGSLQSGVAGVGITNTRDRLAQLFGARGELVVAEQRGGVVARVAIPLERESAKKVPA
jgi:LytS/YehU family sensor histidine kinase